MMQSVPFRARATHAIPRTRTPARTASALRLRVLLMATALVLGGLAGIAFIAALSQLAGSSR